MKTDVSNVTYDTFVLTCNPGPEISNAAIIKRHLYSEFPFGFWCLLCVLSLHEILTFLLCRYVVRAKSGKKQSSKDASGKTISSAGASLRRHNELALKKV